MGSENFKIENMVNNDIGLITLIFSMVLLGSFAKKMFINRNNKDYKLHNIYISATVISLIIFSLIDVILKYVSERMVIALCILSGLVSIEALKKISTLRGLKSFLDYVLGYFHYKKE